MTITRGRDAAAAPERTRRSHVPGDGSVTAAAVEQARREMLRDVTPRKKNRIGADALMEALIRQNVDVLFGYPGA